MLYSIVQAMKAVELIPILTVSQLKILRNQCQMKLWIGADDLSSYAA